MPTLCSSIQIMAITQKKTSKLLGLDLNCIVDRHFKRTTTLCFSTAKSVTRAIVHAFVEDSGSKR